MKDQARVLGISSGDPRIHLNEKIFVGVLYRGWQCIEGIIKGRVRSDRFDATENITSAIFKSLFYKQIRCILLDRLKFIERNTVNLIELYKNLRLPILLVSRRRVFECLNEEYILGDCSLNKSSLKFYGIGLDKISAKKIIKSSSSPRGFPEALTVAKKIATAYNLYMKKLK
jgi:endonuclease V-like protein UPF0215 family